MNHDRNNVILFLKKVFDLQFKDDKKIKIASATERPTLDLMDQIEELHSALLEKWDKINEMRNELKSEYVPTSVCTHLEQCIKETEVRMFQTQSKFCLVFGNAIRANNLLGQKCI